MTCSPVSSLVTEACRKKNASFSLHSDSSMGIATVIPTEQIKILRSWLHHTSRGTELGTSSGSLIPALYLHATECPGYEPGGVLVADMVGAAKNGALVQLRSE